MIVENDSIELKNVVSRKYGLHYSQFPEVMKDFYQLLHDKKLTPTGTLFYSLSNIPIDEQMAVEVFATVKESYVPQDTDLFFRSYFTVTDMIMTYYFGNVEKLTELAYAELIRFVEENDFELASPFFHFFKGDQNFQYIELKVGVR